MSVFSYSGKKNYLPADVGVSEIQDDHSIPYEFFQEFNFPLSRVKGQDYDYKVNAPITPKQFVAILENSTLAKRRPTHNMQRIARMIEHSNFNVTAWHEGQLIGMARCVTDYAYCCYLSDLAVDCEYQSKGVGKLILHHMKQFLGDEVSIILLAAPNSVSFYRHLGLKQADNAFVLPRAL